MTPISLPDFDALYLLFPDSSDKPHAEAVPADALPEPYHRLLVHTHHMTVTVEGHFGQPIDVILLDSRHEGDGYARKILLALKDSGTVVQFGLVRIDLSACPTPVRAAILEGQTPLGRVLIEHDMLRRIEPTAYLRVHLAPKMAGWFACSAAAETYGRMGVIYTDERPVVEVLEILAPIHSIT